jgi:integrase
VGYPQDKAAAHGFRATASTILNGRRFDRDVIKAALAHQDQNEICRIYSQSLYMTHTSGRKARVVLFISF